VAGLQAG